MHRERDLPTSLDAVERVYATRISIYGDASKKTRKPSCHSTPANYCTSMVTGELWTLESLLRLRLAT